MDLGAEPPRIKICRVLTPTPPRVELRTKDPDSSTTFNFLLLKRPDISVIVADIDRVGIHPLTTLSGNCVCGQAPGK